MKTEHWNLEEIPYETNDAAGGWYLHFDPTGDATDAVLYMSKANVTPDQAHRIAASLDLLKALAPQLDRRDLRRVLEGNADADWPTPPSWVELSQSITV